MKKAFRIVLALSLVVLSAIPLSSCLPPSETKAKAMLPAGFNGVKLPGPHLDGFLYVNQGIPFYLGPDTGFSVNSQIDQAAVSLSPSEDNEDLLYSVNSGSWQNALSTDAVVPIVSSTTLQESYPDAWNLLQHLPVNPPDKIIGAGFLKATGNVYNSLARLNIDSTAAGQVSQVLDKAKISQVAFGIYANGTIEKASLERIDTAEEGGLSILVVGKSSLGINIFGKNIGGSIFLDLGLSGTLAKAPTVDKDAFVFLAAPNGPMYVKELAGYVYATILADDDTARSIFASLSDSGGTQNLEYQLAEKYAPILQTTGGEPYLTNEVSVLSDDAVIKDDKGNVVLDLRSVAKEDRLSLLGGFNDQNFYLDFVSASLITGPETYVPIYQKIAGQYRNVIYARVVQQEGKTIVQYWLFYFFDYGPVNIHEGDWEKIELIFNGTDLTQNLTPESVFYSQHTGGETKAWDKAPQVGGHPYAYVALGTHANYFSSRESFPGSFDTVNGSGIIEMPSGSATAKANVMVTYDLIVFPNDDNQIKKQTPWLNFGGHWGEESVIIFNSGPRTPIHQVLWNKPLAVEREGRYYIVDDNLVLR